MKRLKISTLVALVVLCALTAYLFAVNRVRRRERVPEQVVQLRFPPITIGSRQASDAMSVAFSPDSKQLAIGANFNKVLICDVQTGRLQQATVSHRPAALGWSRDGRCVSGMWGGDVFWRESGQASWQSYVFCPGYMKRQHSFLSTLGFDGSLVLAASYSLPFPPYPWENGSIVCHDVHHKKPLWRMQLKDNPQGMLPHPCGLALSSDEKTFAVAKAFYGANMDIHAPNFRAATKAQAAKDTENLAIFRWAIEIHRVADQKLLCTLKTPLDIPDPFMSEDQTDDPRLPLVFGPDGSLLAIALRGEVMLYSTQTGALMATLQLKEPFDSTSAPQVAFSANGHLLAIAGEGVIEVWSVPHKRLLQIFRAIANTLTFSADGKWLASDDFTNNECLNQIKIWEVGSLD